MPEMVKESAPVDASADAESQLDVDKGAGAQQQVPVAPARGPGDDLVDFDGPDDPDNPKNWSKGKKWAITASMGGMTFVVTFASSIYVSQGRHWAIGCD